MKSSLNNCLAVCFLLLCISLVNCSVIGQLSDEDVVRIKSQLTSLAEILDRNNLINDDNNPIEVINALRMLQHSTYFDWRHNVRVEIARILERVDAIRTIAKKVLRDLENWLTRNDDTLNSLWEGQLSMVRDFAIPALRMQIERRENPIARAISKLEAAINNNERDEYERKSDLKHALDPLQILFKEIAKNILQIKSQVVTTLNKMKEVSGIDA